MKNVVRQFFGADIRSLAFFRIGLGILILLDLIDRAKDLQAHYTDFGVLPRAPLIDNFLNEWHLSVHLISGRAEFQAILFIFAGVLAFLLLIGYKTRLATILSWLFLISLHARNPMVLNGGDTLLKMLLFFAMFLPLGAAYSIDSLNKTAITKKLKLVFSLATFALLFQIVVLYLTNFLKKTGPEWFPNGTAVYYALAIDQHIGPLGEILFNFPNLMKISTYLIYFWWLIGPILLIFSLKKMRTMVIAMFILIFIGIGASMDLGLFPLIVIVSFLAFLPSSFWDKRKESLREKQEGLTLYYDDSCGLCSFSVKFVKTFFVLPFCDVQPARKSKQASLKMEKYNSWILEDKHKNYYHEFDVLVVLFGVSPIFSPLFLQKITALRIIRKIGTRLYREVSSRRNKVPKCMIPKPLAPEKSPSAFWKISKALFLIFIILQILLWNIDNIADTKLIDKYKWTGDVLRTDQKWNMFSPSPPVDDGWYIINATLNDGTNFDLYNNKFPVDWEKPDDVAKTYKSHRWRGYLMHIWFGRNATYYNKLYYGKYLCRDWNEKRSENKQLKEFEIIFMKEDTQPDYGRSEPKKIVIWRHGCY